MSPTALTPLQAKSYKFIQEYLAKNSFSPTAQEIAAHLGRKNSSTGQHAKEHLLKKGLIEVTDPCLDTKASFSRTIKPSSKKLCYKPKEGFVLLDKSDPLALTHSAFTGKADFVFQYDDSVSHGKEFCFFSGDKVAFSFATQISDFDDLSAIFLIMGTGDKPNRLIKNNRRNKKFLKTIYDKKSLVCKYLGLSRSIPQFDIV